MKRYISLLVLAGAFAFSSAQAEEPNPADQQPISSLLSQNLQDEAGLAASLSSFFDSEKKSCDQMTAAYREIMEAAEELDDAELETVTKVASKLAIVSMAGTCLTPDAAARLVAQIGNAGGRENITGPAIASAAADAAGELGVDSDLMIAATGDPLAVNPDEQIAGPEAPAGNPSIGPAGGGVTPTDPTVPTFFDDQIVVSPTP